VRHRLHYIFDNEAEKI